MTVPASTTRSVELSRDQLVALHPYVINVPDGRLASGGSTPPTTVQDFRTVAADVDAIFSTHLPEFVARNGGSGVPLVIYAHGGLVPKASGLGIACKQVEWWKANGAFPVQFVWETALGASLWDAVRDHVPGLARGFIEDALDAIIEKVLRGARGRDTWGAMKRTAELASEPDGGARYFARKLGEYMTANPGAITVHAVGHSAGSIFHSYLVPQMLAAGVPAIASLNLLAPAVRVDEFEKRVLTPAVLDRIEALTLFTMSEHFEKLDTCMGVYRKSLLYLIREALEREEHAEVLGLQESVRRNPRLRQLFGAPGAGRKGTVMWSETIGGGLRSSSRSRHHGDFDDDKATMESLARRILDRDDLAQSFPAKAKGRSLGDPWLTSSEAFADVEARQAELAQHAGGGRRKALCIGIDAYPGKYALSGCVADAKAWGEALGEAGFEVDTVLDEEATLEEMVERIQGLVVASEPGDVLVVQYSGHGTAVPDLDGDEREEDGEGNNLADEAICPVDFMDGNLLIDDDLGQIWDKLPDEVSLTIFFDSCHSGGAQRDLDPLMAAPMSPTAKPRLVTLPRNVIAAYTDKRGPASRAVTSPVDTSRDNERGVFFGACLPTEVAWESEGHGDFTKRALPLLRSSLGSATNQSFFDALLAAFGDGRRQTPVLRPDYLAARQLLVSLTQDRVPATELESAGTTGPATGPSTGSTGSSGTPTDRERATASILRGLADLLEA